MHPIEEAVHTILNGESVPAELYSSISHIQDLFAKISGVKAYAAHDIQHTDVSTKYGVAISTQWAADCMMDFKRTTTFLLGLNQAINVAMQKFPNETIRILYAGTGPYATLFTPLTFLFKPGEIICTAIDIQQDGIVSLNKIIKEFEIGPFFDEVLCADAFEYQSPENSRPHIIIFETMQFALKTEPQFALAHHLAPQLVDGGFMVPEEINLDLCLYDPPETDCNGMDQHNSNRTVQQHTLYNLLKLNQEYVRVNGPIPLQDLLPKVSHTIPVNLNSGNSLGIFTSINIFDKIVLKPNDSGLTIPLQLMDISRMMDDFNIHLAYQLNPVPDWQIRLSEIH